MLQDAWAGSRLGNLPASELRLRLFIQHNTLLKKYIVDECDHGFIGGSFKLPEEIECS